MAQLAERHIGPLAGRSVLEVGAGWGFFGDACRALGATYEGLEMNADQAQRLRARGLNVAVGAIPPYPDGDPVDVIWMSHVLEHASSYLEAREFIAGALARLAPGGRLVVIAPDILSWRQEFWNVDWSHGFPTSLRRVSQLLEDCGYRVVAAEHHAGARTGISGAALALLFRLIPYRVLDRLALRLAGRPLAHSFMGVFGWRQILVIGEPHR